MPPYHTQHRLFCTILEGEEVLLGLKLVESPLSPLLTWIPVNHKFIGSPRLKQPLEGVGFAPSTELSQMKRIQLLVTLIRISEGHWIAKETENTMSPENQFIYGSLVPIRL